MQLQPLRGPGGAAVHAFLAPAFAALDAAARTLLRGVALGAGLGYGTALAPFVEDRPYQGTPASLMHVVRYEAGGAAPRHVDGSLLTLVYSPGTG